MTSLGDGTRADAHYDRTRELLSPIITRPTLKPHLLRRPPFQFLRDVIANVSASTGFLRGLYTDAEAKADLAHDRPAKEEFLRRAFQCVSRYLGEPVPARENRVVCGLDSRETNTFLQMLARAAGSGGDPVRARGIVEDVLAEGVKPIPSDSTESAAYTTGNVRRSTSLGGAGASLPIPSGASDSAVRGSVASGASAVVRPSVADWQPIDLVIGGNARPAPKAGSARSFAVSPNDRAAAGSAEVGARAGAGAGGADGDRGEGAGESTIRPSVSCTSIASAPSKPSPRRYTAAGGPAPAAAKMPSGEFVGLTADLAPATISRELSSSAFDVIDSPRSSRNRSAPSDVRSRGRSPAAFGDATGTDHSPRAERRRSERSRSGEDHYDPGNGRGDRVRSLARGYNRAAQPIAGQEGDGWDGGIDDNSGPGGRAGCGGARAEACAGRGGRADHATLGSDERRQLRKEEGESLERQERRRRARAKRVVAQGRGPASSEEAWMPAGSNDRPGLRGLEETRLEREYLQALRERRANGGGDGRGDSDDDDGDDRGYHGSRTGSGSGSGSGSRGGHARGRGLRQGQHTRGLDGDRVGRTNNAHPTQRPGATFGLPVRVCQSAFGDEQCNADLRSYDAIDVNFLCNEQAWRPIHVAARLGRAKCIRDLVSRGSYVNVCDVVHRTPLHVACYHGHVGAVRALLDCGAMVDAQTVYGDTPLHIAASKGYRDVIDALVHHGAEVYLPNRRDLLPHEVATVSAASAIMESAKRVRPVGSARPVVSVDANRTVERSLRDRSRGRRVNKLSGAKHKGATGPRLGWVPPSDVKDYVTHRFDYPSTYSFFEK